MIAPELEIPERRVEIQEYPRKRTQCLDVRYDQTCDFGEGDGHNDEINAAKPEPEPENSEKKGDQRGDESAEKHADPGRQAEGQGQIGGGVGADADIERVTQGYMARVSGQHIPCLSDIGPIEDHDKDAQDDSYPTKGEVAAVP